MRALDELLPRFDWNEVHSICVDADPGRALAAILALPVVSDRAVGTLFALRGLRRGGSIADALVWMGFSELARRDGEVVFGGTGTPWRPGRGIGPFADARPGTVRISTDFRCDGATLSTETRIAAVDDAARRAFGRYWRVVGPFSALIRRRWLAAAVRELA